MFCRSIPLTSIILFIFLTIIPTQIVAAPVNTFSEAGKGVLTVVSNQVVSGSLPKGATNVPVLFVRLSASCDADIQMNTLTLLDRGLGASNDIRSLSLAEGMQRIGRSKSLDQNTHTVRFAFPPSFIIQKCTERTLFINAAIQNDAVTSSEHLFAIDSITSSAKEMTLTQEDAEKNRLIIRPKSAGHITVQFLSTKERLQYGRRDAVARIQLSADAISDHYIDSILFTNEEDARDYNLENITLETRSGKKLTVLKKSMKGREIFLQFDPPFLLERSQTVVLLLKADIKTSSRKVRFTIKEEGDIKAREVRVRGRE